MRIIMSLLQNTAAFFYVILFCLSLCSSSFAVPIRVSEVSKDNNYHSMLIVLLQPIDTDANEDDGSTIKDRVKRATSAGKFADSAKMPALKMLRLQLQLFRNIVAIEPIAGRHPLSSSVPKPVVMLIRDKIFGFFFPDVGDSKVED